MKRRRPLFFILLFFSAGILLGSFLPMPFVFWASLASTFLLLNLISGAYPKISAVLIWLCVVFLAAGYTVNYQAASYDNIDGKARYYQGKSIQAEGVIASGVEKRKFFRGKKISFLLKLSRFKTKWGWKDRKGTVLINAFREMPVNYGDYVRLEGKLHRPFEFDSDGNFSYRDYLNNRGIRWIISMKKSSPLEILKPHQGNVIKSASLRLRNKFMDVLDSYLTENESGIMKAILLGDRTGIPAHIRELFVRTGTAHILAISGLHVGIVAALIYVFVRLIPAGRKAHILCTICLVIFYSFMTGGRPSVVRSTIMAVILLFSFVVERDTETINSLSLAGIIILVMNPMSLFDIGFQLSFSSVFTIICFYPILIKLFSARPLNKDSKFVQFLMQSSAVSLAAWVGVGGFIAYYFHMITPVTIIANLIIVPFITIIVSLGLGLMLAGLLWPPIALAFSWCLKIALSTMTVFIYLFDCLPGSFFYVGNVTYWHIMIYYSIVWISYALISRYKIDKEGVIW